MTPRERFLAAATGKPVDRLPFMFGGPRASTFEAWSRQGLTPDLLRGWSGFIGEEGFCGVGAIDFGPVPPFEERTIEVRGNRRIWQDHWGVLREDAIEQPTPGFATRRYLRFPVEARADFLAMRKRFDPASPARYAPESGGWRGRSMNPDGYRVHVGSTPWYERVEICNQSDQPVILVAPGLFWTVRDWCGFEGLCALCADNPDLVREMMDFWTDFLIQLLSPPLDAIRVDLVILNEDMGYKTASMISPAMMRRLMLPGYHRLAAFFAARGVQVVAMDTDGHCSQVAEVFHPDTIAGLTPVEIAANNDPETLLTAYPTLFLMGGIDKRELVGDRQRVREEVCKRYRSVRRHGRYIPMVDHGVPPDVPLRNFLYMVELIRGYAQGADLETFEPSCTLEAALGPFERPFDANEAIVKAYANAED